MVDALRSVPVEADTWCSVHSTITGSLQANSCLPL